MDTIFALASAPGKAGVAVIRVSGPDAFVAGNMLAGSLPEPRMSAVRVLKDADGQYLDQALVLRFDAGASFTGEDTVEFHLHGSTAVVRAVTRVLADIDGLRPALAGEFTRRALENERLDLSQVESLADLIEAETEAQRRQALRIFSGALGDKVSAWRLDIIKAASLLEATIDFVDEEVPVDVTADVISIIDRTCESLEQEIAGFHAAERIRDGFEVAIIGAPNAGKSTLLNRLAQREAAIVSEIAGTTRDIIEVRMDIGGFPVTLLDTAGLRESDDPVEKIGIERAISRAKGSDLRVHLAAGGDVERLDDLEAELIVVAKDDEGLHEDGVSGLTGRGVDRLLDKILERIEAIGTTAGVASRERHRIALHEGLGQLLVAREIVLVGSEQYDIASEELRVACNKLENLLGLVGIEDILDHVFSSFCIGK